MNLKKQSYYSVSSSRAPIRNTADYSPFGIQLDGRTISYVPPAPAPPSVTVVYQHKFDDNPSTHPYTTAPNQLNTKLTNVSWTNSQSSWTNFAGFTGKAIATNSATPDTTRLYLNLTVNSGFMLDVKSYSFYHRSSTTGYTNYQLLVNGILVGSGSIFVSSGSTLQSTGTINVANAVAGLTGSVTVTLKLFGGSNGNNATFRLDDFTLNGYTQEVQVYAESYRRGFNGMEKDDEVKGGGNSYDFGARMYDARVGRFLSRDPKEAIYTWQSSYCYASNSPILFVDENGEGPIVGWVCKKMSYDKKTNKACLSYKINVHRTIYIVNNSKMNLNPATKAAICANIKDGYSNSSFSYDLNENEIIGLDQYMDRQYVQFPDNANLNINIEMQFSANVQFVNSLDEITDTKATIIEMVDDIPLSSNGGKPLGIASSILGDAIKVQADRISPRDINGTPLKKSKVTIHEILHTDGADDLYKYLKGKLIKDNNSMMGSANNNVFELSNVTKSEISNHYFHLTRMALDLERGINYEAQKASGLTDLVGSYNFRIDNKDSNKEQLKSLE